MENEDGFITILLIPVPTIRELAIAASIGVAAIIVTNLILLPLMLSYLKPKAVYRERVARRKEKTVVFWHKVGLVTQPRLAKGLVACFLLIANHLPFQRGGGVVEHPFVGCGFAADGASVGVVESHAF